MQSSCFCLICLAFNPRLTSDVDKHFRRRPFTWMKRLANLKNSTSDSGTNGKRNQQPSDSKGKKTNILKNNPYPVSAKSNANPSVPNSGNGHLSFYTPPSGRSVSYTSPSHSKESLPVSSDDQQPQSMSKKSAAPTVSTTTDTVNSETATADSKAGTTVTVGGALSSIGRTGGEGSTFSSPAPSVRSLTTTLTTIQSAAPSNLLQGPNQPPHPGGLAIPHSTQHPPNSTHTSHFTHQFPSSPPASAIPSHLSTGQQSSSSGGHPSTYTTATANNLLTDNASILTLASSSKRRRRNSLDTNASVRALAPSSLFGGSRESLPLSVLSANINSSDQPIPHSARLPNTERASVYSSSGIAPALSSERNSYYANKATTGGGDGGSVRSGLISHGRNDSITGSIGGIAAASPLASPREGSGAAFGYQERASRRSSGWREVGEEEEDGEEEREVVRERGHED